MILRINQLPILQIETAAGWPDDGLQGPIQYKWPYDTLGFEMTIREHDESNRPVPERSRQAQLRAMIPSIARALAVPEQAIVARLDGPMRRGELPGAFIYATDDAGHGHFAISAVQSFEMQPYLPVGSVRFEATIERLAALCGDESVGLARNVRLRLFSVSGQLVNPLLDTEAPDDERWPDILPRTAWVLQTARSLQALHLITGRFSPTEVTQRLTRQLTVPAAV